MPASTWQGRIIFGPVIVPVCLTKASVQKRIKFHYVCNRAADAASIDGAGVLVPEPDSKVRTFPLHQPAPERPRPPLPGQLERIHYLVVGEGSNAPVSRDRVFKAYKVGPDDEYAVFTCAEINALRAPSSSELELTQFTGTDEIDRNFIEASYYVRPDPGGEKPYALLHYVLAENGCAALGELPFSGREYTVAVRPGKRGLVLHRLFYTHEVRVEAEYTADRSLITEEELELAGVFLNARRRPFDPSKLKDKHDERVLQAIMARSQAMYPAREDETEPRRAPVLDIAEALRQSLEAFRKPVKSETGKGKRGGKKRTSRTK
jgi:DNA end-binding protein Ku